MKPETEKETYIRCIQNGVDLSYGKISLCDLTNYRYTSVKYGRRYQVHSDDRKAECSKIYDELEPAVLKFMDLKRRVKRIK